MGAKVAKTTTHAWIKSASAAWAGRVYAVYLAGQSDTMLFKSYLLWTGRKSRTDNCYKICENVVVTSPSVGFSLKWYNDNVGLEARRFVWQADGTSLIINFPNKNKITFLGSAEKVNLVRACVLGINSLVRGESKLLHFTTAAAIFVV